MNSPILEVSNQLESFGARQITKARALTGMAF